MNKVIAPAVASFFLIACEGTEITSEPEIGSAIADPRTPQPWSDSYSVDGQCYCDSTYDHGLVSVTMETPAGIKSVPQICADIRAAKGTGRPGGRIYYNTIQCGHDPVNFAPDETDCPGIPRAPGRYTGERCFDSGATWNLDTVYLNEDTRSSSSCQTPVSGLYYSECTDASTDTVGEGWGWENGDSCVVTGRSLNATSAQALIACENEAGRFGGFGPDGCVVTDHTCQGLASTDDEAVETSSCITPVSGAFFQECFDASTDSVGEGWGWENGGSCVVTGNSLNTDSARVWTACVNEDGVDGVFGPDSCVVTNNTCQGI